MKTKLSFFLVMPLFVLAISGCGSKTASGQDLVGTWTQTVVLDPDNDIANQIKSAMADAANMGLDIKADDSFTLTVAGNASTGTWVFEDDQLTLTYTDVKGMVLDDGKTSVLTLSGDGDTLETKPSPSGSTTVFKRS